MARDLCGLISLLGYFFISLVISVCGVCSQVRILGICDQELKNMCLGTFEKHFKENIYSNGVNITWEVIEGSKNYDYNLRNLTGIALSGVWDVGIAFGNSSVINAATTFATSTQLPLLVYDTSDAKKPIFPDSFIKLHPDRYDVGIATSELFFHQRETGLCVVIQDRYLADGFLDGLWAFDVEQAGNFSKIIVISHKDNFRQLFTKLHQIHEDGCKVVIVHCEPTSVQRVIEVAEIAELYKTGFAWVLIDSSNHRFTDLQEALPNGILIVTPKEDIEQLSEILKRSLSSLQSIIPSVYSQYSSNYSDFRDHLYSSITALEYNESSTGLAFDVNRRRTNATFQLYNKQGETSSTGWINVGLFTNHINDIRTIIWPGSSIFGPLVNHGQFYRVVTRPAEPMVFIKNRTDGDEPCLGEIRCFKSLGEDSGFLYHPNLPDNVNKALGNTSYEMYCCSGLAVDLLEALSTDLNFDYLLYFEDDNDYGTYENGSWSGMMGDLTSESADIIIGAFSINSERSNHILFTEAFHISGYSMVTPSARTKPAIDAFLAPLDWSVYFCIFLSATVTGFATSILEWNSPFGLNPWGKKRSKNYTLGSGLVMAFSVLFGHTVSTKSPKGWPSKVLQNFWSGLAIFIVSSYTANLAAYLAGNIGEDEISSIYDEKINLKTVSAIRSSAVVQYLSKINTHLSGRLTERDFQSMSEVIYYLRSGGSEVYLDDTTILEYALSVYDTNCSILFSGREFGENLYGFGLSKDDVWLRDRLSSLIMSYLESGYIDDIQRRYVNRRECSSQRSTYIKFGLEHTGGLFIGLVCAVFCAVMLIGLEHLIYLYLVPYIRNKRSNSKWKSRNLEFINQRLYRTIMSQKLVSPQQTAREMVKLMKDRQFARLFQKNELSRPKATPQNDSSGLRFMDLTDSIMKSQKNQDKPIKDTNENSVIFSTSSSGALYQVAEETETEIEDSLFDKVKFTVEDEHSCEEKEQSFSNVSSTLVTVEVVPPPMSTPNNLKRPEEGSLDTHQGSRPDSSPVNRVQVNCLWKRHSSAKYHERDSDPVIREARTKRIQSETFSDKRKFPENTSETKISDTSFSEKKLSDKKLPENSFPDKTMHNDLHRKFGTWPSLPSIENNSPEVSHKRKKSHKSSPSMTSSMLEQTTLDTARLIPSDNGYSDSEDNDNVNYYKHSLKMKDNRVKSTIRRHAIAKFRRQSSSVLDECAVDALTKEDLMVLWKRSEIELQTKLNRVTLQNAHLKKLLRMVDKRRTSEGTDEHLDSELLCTRL
ncbi:glutamate receptor ionotropic, NMDA 3A-like [Mizuhopecten yessoensis]|uniref:Glutamate receptor ionotropic, NMDA 3A n=1 Tax=Mizuhopecten yessoensis TaxID=6573 RepID=A0A210Q7N5_MIZYE|nr:glutamate receptor ionotropic, NMDA 3A-like [Mizuhopecten yessoensis]OWF44758.1 Glutamate receptor ionotropic, NMDA 3A [Mizuhopecten yessoensis]